MNRRYDHCKSQRGFTMVELVLVIVLIGILGLGSRALFSSRESYAGFLAKDQLIAAALLAQEHALGVSALNNAVTLTVGTNGDEWYFWVIKDGVNVFDARQEHSGGTMRIDGVAIGDGASQSFVYSGDASLVSASDHEISFNSGYDYYVCLSAAGYPWQSSGACP